MARIPAWISGASVEDVVARVTGALVKVYGQYETDMLTWLGHQLKQAETPETERSLGRHVANVREEAWRARQLSVTLLDDAAGAALTMVEQAGEYGMAKALSQLEGRGLAGRDYPSVSPAVYSVLGDLSNALDEAHRRILRVPDDMFREINALGTAESMLHGHPLKQRHRRIWEQYVNNGIHGFTDRSGRNWNLVSYAEMASRTTTARAFRAQQEYTLVENDMNLVAVEVTGDACPDCISWSGRVLSLDGSPAGTYLQWSPITGEDEQVTVHATVEYASSTGHLFGPNCQCTQVPYLPGDTPPPQLEYDEAEHKARESQRYHEREIRRLKREALVDPDFTKEYQQKIRGHQANIRDLVDEYGLNRKREREQVNHGYRRTST